MSIIRQDTYLYLVQFNVLYNENVNTIYFTLPMTIHGYKL